MSPHQSVSDADGESGVAAASDLLDSWVRATEHLANSVVEANKAVLSAFEPTDRAPTDGIASVTYERDGWTTERTVTVPEAIGVGDQVRFSKQFSDGDVRAFARASGDTNRLHLDDEFAAGSRFEHRIVHGTLVAGLISAALARLPGLTIYLSQDLQFLRPVDIDERMTAVVEVVEDMGGDRYRLTTAVVDEDDTPVVSGEATVLVDELPA